VQRVGELVREQDVVMMKEEGHCGAAVVPTCMVKIEGCGIVPAALSPSERAGSCATSIAPITGQALREHQYTYHTAVMRPSFAKLAGGNGEIFWKYQCAELGAD
jgi:hypothetical protein